MKKRLHLIISILIGCIFILSGIGKLLSIGSFETYIFSLDFLPERLSVIISRLFIGVELTIGFFLLLNLFPKLTWYLTSLLIFGFTVFLLIQFFSGSTENCNCFGELITFSIGESILKNIGIAVLLCLMKVFRQDGVLSLNKKFSIPILLICFSIPFLIDFPASTLSKLKEFPVSDFTDKSDLIKQSFSISDSFNIYQGKKVLCFFSLRCIYCRKAAHKLTIWLKKLNFDKNVLVFFSGKEENVKWFYGEAESESFYYRMMDKKEISLITGGKVPRIMLLQEGIVKSVLKYEDITEERLIGFFIDNSNH